MSVNGGHMKAERANNQVGTNEREQAHKWAVQMSADKGQTKTGTSTNKRGKWAQTSANGGHTNRHKWEQAQMSGHKQARTSEWGDGYEWG
jgi:hypothetical protein